LFTAIGLARRGRDVTLIDRDPGPAASGEWRRRGVMQFHHAHSFRGQVVDALTAEMPDVLDALVAAGATVATAPALGNRPAALRCRRMVFERELRRCAANEPLIRHVNGHAGDVVARNGRATGVRVGEHLVKGELVIDASGRASRFARTLRGRGEGADCGATYAGRQYRLRPGADPGPTNSVIGLSLTFARYGAVVFVHDSGTFTVTLIHTGSDERWHRLRHSGVFDAAVGLIPAVRDWIHAERAAPISAVLPGGRLRNVYRGQLDRSGRPFLPGLVAVGDALCTTTPLAGRGVALSFTQVRELIRLIDRSTDPTQLPVEFDDWCTRRVKPWFTDHLHTDTERVRRWSGHDVDLDGPLPSDLIVAAAEADPRLGDIVGPYASMDALPASLRPAEPRAREIYATGWRPSAPPGPGYDDLIEVVSTTPAIA
jgi:2-polyprenyl-6-methoxyphenol hydroxylase-like FAD-dependent oxidoreductase